MANRRHDQTFVYFRGPWKIFLHYYRCTWNFIASNFNRSTLSNKPFITLFMLGGVFPSYTSNLDFGLLLYKVTYTIEKTKHLKTRVFKGFLEKYIHIMDAPEITNMTNLIYLISHLLLYSYSLPLVLAKKICTFHTRFWMTSLKSYLNLSK